MANISIDSFFPRTWWSIYLLDLVNRKDIWPLTISMIILGSVLKLLRSYWSPVLVSGKKCQNTLTALVLQKCRRPFAGFFGHFKKTKASQVGYHSLSKSSNFSKCSKMLKIGIFSKRWIPIFGTLFFQIATILRPMDIITWNQLPVTTNFPNFLCGEISFCYPTPF